MVVISQKLKAMYIDDSFIPSYDKIVKGEGSLEDIINGVRGYLKHCPLEERKYHMFVLGIYEEERERELMREVDFVYNTGRR